jgi:hypothetical protein
VNKLEEWKNPTASPLNLKNLSGIFFCKLIRSCFEFLTLLGFPNALVHIAGMDVVRDGSLYFVNRYGFMKACVFQI